MSASEKLREAAARDTWPYADDGEDWYDRFLAALPLIADFVEAAEGFVELPDVSIAEAKAEDMWRAIDHYKQMASTLAVLREQLEAQ